MRHDKQSLIEANTVVTYVVTLTVQIVGGKGGRPTNDSRPNPASLAKSGQAASKALT